MKIISFGYACDTASQLRRIAGQTEAYPFDWLLTPFQALSYLLSTRFDCFLDPESLTRDVKGDVYDKKSKIYFLHDFSKERSVAEQMSDISGKYARRINRLYDTVASGEDITFVRSRQYQDQEAMTLEKCQALADIVSFLPGIGRFRIIGVNYVTEPVAATHAGNLSIFSIKRPEPFRWQGDDAEWESIVKHIQK